MKEHTFLANARRRVERRMFLKALGLGLSLPLALKLSQNATAQDIARPKRLLVIFRPHGVPPEHYNPVVNAANPTDFTFAQSGVSILGPLEPYKSLVNVLQGFKYPGASTHEGILKILSNVSSGDQDETTPRTTFEHVIGNALGSRPLVLGAAAQRDYRNLDKDTKLIWDGQPVAPEKNPFKAYDKAFGALMNPDAQSDAAVQAQLRERLTALTERQLEGLGTELTALTRTATKLNTHLEAVRALREAGGPAAISCTTAPTLPALEAIRPTLLNRPDETYLDQANFPALYRAQLEVAAHALICNMTQVAVVMPMYTNADFDFTFAEAPGAHHSALSHTGPQQDAGPNANMATRTPFAKAQRWFVQTLVDHVITLFDQPDPADPGRKIIDNTIIYMCSEIGEGAWHGSNTRVIQVGPVPMKDVSYLPLATIGGGSGALKTGQVLNFNPNAAPNQEVMGDRPAGDIYLSICQAMGVPIASFGSATNRVQEILA
jgi:hypothetical protein